MPVGESVVSLRIAGMFIVGIAGMNNVAVTSASATGLPDESFTVTSKVLSPVRGGSGCGWNVMLSRSVGAEAVDEGAPAGGS